MGTATTGPVRARADDVMSRSINVLARLTIYRTQAEDCEPSRVTRRLRAVPNYDVSVWQRFDKSTLPSP
jgi:hypothetical protein